MRKQEAAKFEEHEEVYQLSQVRSSHQSHRHKVTSRSQSKLFTVTVLSDASITLIRTRIRTHTHTHIHTHTHAHTTHTTPHTQTYTYARAYTHVRDLAYMRNYCIALASFFYS